MSNKSEPIKSEAPKPLDEGLSRNPYLPVDLAKRAEEKAWYKTEHEKNRQRLLDCLDPTVATSYEDRKTRYEWKVGCKLFRKAVGRNPAYMEEFSRTVVAHNENDAWAAFCDAIGEWPSRHSASPTIIRLKKWELRDPSFGQELATSAG